MNRLILILLMAVSCSTAFAQNLVIDKTSVEQVGKNGAAAVAQEELIGSEFKEMKKEQNSVKKMMAVIERHLDKVDKTQQDISAFKKEGPAMRLFLLKFKRATKELELLAKALKENPKGAIGSARTITSLSTDIYGISSSMISVVVDARFSLPGLPKNPKASMNLLEPQERLAFFERCCYDMDIVIFKIKQMQFEIQYTNSLSEIALKIAPLTYSNYSFGEEICNDIIKLWKN